MLSTHSQSWNIIIFCILFSWFPFTGSSGSQHSSVGLAVHGGGSIDVSVSVCSCIDHKPIGCGPSKFILIVNMVVRSSNRLRGLQCLGHCTPNNTCSYNMTDNYQDSLFQDIAGSCNGTHNCTIKHNKTKKTLCSEEVIPILGLCHKWYSHVLTVQYRCCTSTSVSCQPPSTTSTSSTAFSTTTSQNIQPSWTATSSSQNAPTRSRVSTATTSQNAQSTTSHSMSSPTATSPTTSMTSSTSNAAESFQQTSKKSSAGMYAGVGVGCLAVVTAAVVTTVLCCRRKRQSGPKNSNLDVAFNNSAYEPPNPGAGGSSSQVIIGHLAQDSSASRNLPKGEEDYSYATTPNFAESAGSNLKTSSKIVNAHTHDYQEYDDSTVGHYRGVGGVSETQSTKSQQKHPSNTDGSPAEIYTQSSKKGDGSKAFTKSSDYESQPAVPTKSPDLSTSSDNYNYVSLQVHTVPETAANSHLDRPENDYQEYDEARDRPYETTDQNSPQHDKSETSIKAAKADPPCQEYNDDDDAEKKKEEDGSAPYQEYETSEAAGDYTYANRYRPTRIMQQVRDNPPVLSNDYGVGNVQESASYAYANVEDK